MENKFTKKQYLTSFTGFAPVWDAEIGCYNINSTNLLFVPGLTAFETKIRTNTSTKEKIVIFESNFFGNIILQPKDFLVVEGGIAVKNNEYMRNKLQYLHLETTPCLKFINTGYQFMWDMEKEENKVEVNSNYGEKFRDTKAYYSRRPGETTSWLDYEK